MTASHRKKQTRRGPRHSPWKNPNGRGFRMVRPNKTERTERMFRMPGPDEEPDEVRLKREDDESQLEDALADYDGDEDPLP